MGISNAPLAFQWFVNQVLVGLRDKVCVSYLDDILVYAKSFESHLHNLRLVLRRLKSEGIKLRADKCLFRQRPPPVEGTDTYRHDTDIYRRDTDIYRRDTDIYRHDTDIYRHDTDIDRHDTDIDRRDTDMYRHDTDMYRHDIDMILTN